MNQKIQSLNQNNLNDDIDQSSYTQSQFIHYLPNVKDKITLKCCLVTAFILSVFLFLQILLLFTQGAIIAQSSQKKFQLSCPPPMAPIITNLMKQTALNYASIQKKIFPSTSPLNYDYTKQKQPITLVCTCSGRRYNLFQTTLNSFFTNNTYPISQIIAVDDDILNQEFTTIRNKFTNITWISTNMKVGQLYAIDTAYKLIKTQFYFHCQQDFIYIIPGFIQRSLNIMRDNPKIAQVILRHWDWDNSTLTAQNILDPAIYLNSAFILNPSLKRKSIYQNNFVKKFGGFSDYSNYQTFGTGAGDYQFCISYYLIQRGYVGYRTTGQFIQHIGNSDRLHRFFFNNGYNCPQ